MSNRGSLIVPYSLNRCLGGSAAASPRGSRRPAGLISGVVAVILGALPPACVDPLSRIPGAGSEGDAGDGEGGDSGGAVTPTGEDPNASATADEDRCRVDEDGDGIADHLETLVKPDWEYVDLNDPDGDGLPNTRDLDSDDDGILDAVESGLAGACAPPYKADRDRFPDFLDLDSDDDGLQDADEVAAGLDPTRQDTDGDRCSDFDAHFYGGCDAEIIVPPADCGVAPDRFDGVHLRVIDDVEQAHLRLRILGKRPDFDAASIDFWRFDDGRGDRPTYDPVYDPTYDPTYYRDPETNRSFTGGSTIRVSLRFSVDRDFMHDFDRGWSPTYPSVLELVTPDGRVMSSIGVTLRPWVHCQGGE